MNIVIKIILINTLNKVVNICQTKYYCIGKYEHFKGL